MMLRFLLVFLLLSFHDEAWTQENESRSIHLLSSEFKPYYSSEMRDYGPLSSIISKSFKISKYKVIIYFFPWQKAMEVATTGFLLRKTGKGKKKIPIDGIFPLWYATPKGKIFHYSRRMIPNEIGLYKRKEILINFKGIPQLVNTLDNARLGVVSGMRYAPFLVSSIGRSLIEEGETNGQNLEKLMRGKLDMILIDRALGEFLQRKLYAKYTKAEAEKLRRIEWFATLQKKYMHVAINRKSEAAAEKILAFNEGYQKLLDSGQAKEVYESFNLTWPGD